MTMKSSHISCAALAALLFFFGHARLCGAIFLNLAPNARECYGIEAVKGDTISGHYELLGGDHSLDITLHSDSPAGPQFVFSQYRRTSGQIQAQAGNNTDSPKKVYYLCFKSWVNHQATLSFNVLVHQQDHHPANLATKDHTDKLIDLVDKASIRMLEIGDQQQFSVTRHAYHRSTTEEANARVMWWSAVKVVFVLSLAAFQIFYMRSFFEVKSVV